LKEWEDKIEFAKKCFNDCTQTIPIPQAGTAPIGQSVLQKETHDSVNVSPILKTKEVMTSEPKRSSRNSTAKVTSVGQLRSIIHTAHDQYKAQWDKNGVVQFKNESIAILQRMFGQQVQFLVAFDQITKEGYRLMAIDEGKTGGQASGGFTGGVNSYYYFQKIEYVR